MFVERDAELDDDQTRNFHLARVLAAAFLVFSTLTVVRIQQSRYENASRWRPPTHRPFSWEVLPFVTEDGMFTAVYLSKDYNFSPVFYNNRKFDGTSVIATSTHDSTFIAVSAPEVSKASGGHNSTDLRHNFHTVNFLSSKEEGRQTIADAPNHFFPDILAITLDAQLFKKRPLIGCNPRTSRMHVPHDHEAANNKGNESSNSTATLAATPEDTIDDTEFCYVALQTVPHEFCTSLYRKTAALYRAVGLASVQQSSATVTTSPPTHNTDGILPNKSNNAHKRSVFNDTGNDTHREYANFTDPNVVGVESRRNLFAVVEADGAMKFSAEDLDDSGMGGVEKPQLFSKRHGRAADVSWTCSAVNSQSNNFTSNAAKVDYEEELQCIRVITGASLGYLHKTYTVASLSEVLRFKDVRRVEPYIWSDAMSGVNRAAVESEVASVISDQSDPLVAGKDDKQARNQLDDPATGLHFCGKPFRHLLALDSVRGRLFFIQPLRALRHYKVPLDMATDITHPDRRILHAESSLRREAEMKPGEDNGGASMNKKSGANFNSTFLDESAQSSSQDSTGKSNREDSFPNSKKIPKMWSDALQKGRETIISAINDLKREVSDEIQQEGYGGDEVVKSMENERVKQPAEDYSEILNDGSVNNQSKAGISSDQRKLSADMQSAVPALRKDGPQFESSVNDVESGVPISPETGMPVAGGVQSLLQPGTGRVQRDSSRLNFCVSQYVFDQYYADVTPCIPIPVAADKEVDIRAPLHMHYDAATNALVFFEFDNHQGGLLLTVMNVDPMSLRFSLRLESLHSGWLLSSPEVSEGTVLILGNMVPYWGIMHIVELQRGRDRRVDVSRFAMNKYEVQ